VSVTQDLVTDTHYDANSGQFIEYKREFVFTNGILTSIGSLASGVVYTAVTCPP
jgi:hypothetical protein